MTASALIEGCNNGIPSHLDLWDLEAKVSKAYEDAKYEQSDVSMLGDFSNKFLKRVLWRRGNQTELFQHHRHSSNCVDAQPSFELTHEVVIRDPIETVKTKGRPKWMCI